MDISISAALNKSNRRDMSIFAGDAFTLTLTVYAEDEENTDPSDMTASTLTLKVYRDPKPYVRDYCYQTEGQQSPEFTIEGTEGDESTTFAFSSSNTNSLIGRYRYVITKTTSSLTSTLVHGILTIN